MALRKPSNFFEDKDKSEVSKSIKDTESFDTFQTYKKNVEKFDAISKFSGSLEDYNENVEKVNYLSQQLLGVQEEIKTLLTKEDLDRAMMSQLLVVEETANDIQSRVKTINNEKLVGIKQNVKELTEQVNQFVSIDVPKYKSLVINSENRAYSRYDEFEGRISESIKNIDSSVEQKYVEIDENISEFQDKLTNKVSSVKKTVGNFIEEEKVNISENEIRVRKELEKFENKLKEISVDVFESSEDDKKFKSELIGRVDNFFENSNSTIDEKVKGIKNLKEELLKKVSSLEVNLTRNESHQSKSLNEIQSNHSKSLNEIRLEIENLKTDNLNELTEKVEEIKDSKEELSKKVGGLEVNLIRNESHIKVQNESLNKIQTDVREAIEKLKIGELEEKNASLARKVNYIQEVLEKFSEKEVLTESITEPATTNNSDPLTPTNQNFVTFDQLQNHYRLFLNRIQQQLSTLGGGGEVRLEFLDDIDRSTAKVDGKFLKYDSSLKKWVGATGGGGVGAAGTWGIDPVGIHTTKVVGINTTSAKSGVALFVSGDIEATGNVTVGGTVTYDDVTNVDSIGIVTARTGINVLAGGINAVGIVTASKLHIDPVGSGFTYSEDLVVQGNARVTGILSIGTSSIVLDASKGELRGLQQIRLHSADTTQKPVIIKQTLEKIVFVKMQEGENGEEVETEDEVSVGIGSTASINTSGIITATAFVGDGDFVELDVDGHTNLDNVSVAGVSTFQNNVHLLDNDRLQIGGAVGAVDGLEISHNGFNSIIQDSGTGSLFFMSNKYRFRNAVDDEDIATFTENGSVELYYDNSKKFETTNTGALVTGIVTATSFSGDVTGTATTATNLNNQAASYYLDYDNFSNTPTIPTNNNELTNGAGFITTSFTNTNQLTNGAGFITGVSTFTGDYNNLTNTPTIITQSQSIAFAIALG